MNIYLLWEINFKRDTPVKKIFIISPLTLWQIFAKTYCFLFWGCRAVRHEDSFWNSWHRTRRGSTWKLEHFDWNLKWKSVIQSENGHWKGEMGVQSIKIKTTVNFLLRSCLIVYVWSLFNNLGFYYAQDIMMILPFKKSWQCNGWSSPTPCDKIVQWNVSKSNTTMCTL